MRKTDIVFLGDILKKYLEDLQKNKNIRELEVIRCWKEIMGPGIMQLTKSIYFDKRTLIIKINSSVIRNDLFMRRERLKKEINDRFGDEVIDNIIIR